MNTALFTRQDSYLDDIPAEVLESYYGSSQTECRPLGDGNVNVTYLVTETNGRKTVLQSLNPIFDPIFIEDFDVVSRYLQSVGWEVPSLVRTLVGQLLKTDETGKSWRVITYIESDTGTAQNADPTAVGGLLGKLHQSLSTLDYEPKFCLPHFHETAYYAGSLEKLVNHLPSDELKTKASEVLAAYADLPKLPNVKPQLIHGDPRISNVLFRMGMPFTFIDFDTLMNGSIWLDIGDFLRSLVERALENDMALDRASLERVVAGYQKAASSETPATEFFESALIAMKQIALELTMRFMIDVVEDSYFTWDSTKYSTRAEHNEARADLQRQIYAQFS